MGGKTGIQWTDATWNPISGCTRVSPGCDNCYAARVVAGRLRNRVEYVGLAGFTPSGRAAFNGQIRLLTERLDQPLRWREPRRVFVNSMSDLFHEGVPDEFIFSVFNVMAAASWHQFQVLTKRPQRMRAWFQWLEEKNPHGEPTRRLQLAGARWPLPSVWLGVSCEDQTAADERIPLLLQTPAAVRFISAEPLLGPIRFSRLHQHCPTHDFPGGFCGGCRDTRFIDWCIVGGESGPGARPMDLAWARAIVEQCQGAGVPVFMKQLGAKPIGWDAYPATSHLGPTGVLRFDDRKGGDPAEWPEDLRVREFPR